jgi:hypothetical protein
MVKNIKNIHIRETFIYKKMSRSGGGSENKFLMNLVSDPTR